MIELYHSTHSTCSQKVRICLAEKGLAWTGHHLNLRRFDQLQPEFLALNPAGLVPVLVDGGQVLTESRIINEYLEDAYPQPRLAPEGAHARARMRLWKCSPRSSAYPMRACARVCASAAAALASEKLRSIDADLSETNLFLRLGLLDAESRQLITPAKEFYSAPLGYNLTLK